MSQHQPPFPLVVLSIPTRLVGVNAHTGQRMWECETEGHQGRLFVEQGIVVYVTPMSVLCLDYATGAVRWKTPLPRLFVTGGSNVLVYAGCVLLMGGGEVICIALQNGAQIWRDEVKGVGQLAGAMAALGAASQVDIR
jgi:outer membrane protein assembly factor BamB